MRGRWTALIFICMIGCTHNSDNAKETNGDTIYVQPVEALTGSQLDHLLRIGVRHKFGERYSGSYSYKLTQSGDTVLDGEFSISFLDSSKYVDKATNKFVEDVSPISKMNYNGRFENNKKVGGFVEELLFDDGIDLYSKWRIAIEFDHDTCTTATFFGAIGTAMPEMNYKFDHLDTCTFERVVHLAQKRWKAEYNRRNKAH